MVAKRSNTPSANLQELKVIQGTTAARESGENLLPSALVLVAVSELDVSVLEGEGRRLGELLEANDDCVLRRVRP